MEKCAVCAKRGDASKIRRCTRCLTTRYCSRDCQARDWPRHKLTCRESSVDGPPVTGQDNPEGATPRASAQNNTNPFASLFDGTFYRGPWQQARSKAEASFPGSLVVDDLTGDLHMTDQEIDVVNPMPSLPIGFPLLALPFMTMPPPRVSEIRSVSQTVLVLRLVCPKLLPGLGGWLVEDSKGNNIYVCFFTPESTAPYFQYEDLQEGHFLCVKQAAMILRVQEKIGFIVLTDPSLVRVFKI